MAPEELRGSSHGPLLPSDHGPQSQEGDNSVHGSCKCPLTSGKHDSRGQHQQIELKIISNSCSDSYNMSLTKHVSIKGI